MLDDGLIIVVVCMVVVMCVYCLDGCYFLFVVLWVGYWFGLL